MRRPGTRRLAFREIMRHGSSCLRRMQPRYRRQRCTARSASERSKRCSPTRLSSRSAISIGSPARCCWPRRSSTAYCRVLATPRATAARYRASRRSRSPTAGTCRCALKVYDASSRSTYRAWHRRGTMPSPTSRRPSTPATHDRLSGIDGLDVVARPCTDIPVDRAIRAVTDGVQSGYRYGEPMGAPIDARTKRLTLVACIMGSGIVLLDGTVVNVALPTIQRALGGGLAAQQWVVNGYLLTLSSLILIGGLAGGSVRRAAGVRARRLGLRRGLAGLRALADDRRARGDARAAGSGGRAAGAELAGGDREHVPGWGRGLQIRARGRDRQLDGVGRDRRRARAAGRRRAARDRLVAVAVRDQHPARRRLRGADPVRGPARRSRAAPTPAKSTCPGRCCARPASPGPCSR